MCAFEGQATIMRVLCLFAVALALTVPALARGFSDAQKTALADLVARYETAVLDRNYWVLGTAVPPRVLERYVAARGDPDLKSDLWVALFVSDSEEIDRQVGDVAEAFSLDFPNARFREAPDGTPYVVLLSTSVVRLRGGSRVKVSSPYLALLDDGAWYLINVGVGGLMGSVKGLYPSFDDVAFDVARQEQL